MDILEFLQKLQIQKIVDEEKSVQECIEAIEKMPFDKAIIIIKAVMTLSTRMIPKPMQK